MPVACLNKAREDCPNLMFRLGADINISVPALANVPFKSTMSVRIPPFVIDVVGSEANGPVEELLRVRMNNETVFLPFSFVICLRRRLLLPAFALSWPLPFSLSCRGLVFVFRLNVHSPFERQMLVTSEKTIVASTVTVPDVHRTVSWFTGFKYDDVSTVQGPKELLGVSYLQNFLPSLKLTFSKNEAREEGDTRLSIESCLDYCLALSYSLSRLALF
jgi:hypothetical protein